MKPEHTDEDNVRSREQKKKKVSVGRSLRGNSTNSSVVQQGMNWFEQQQKKARNNSSHDNSICCFQRFVTAFFLFVCVHSKVAMASAQI